VRRAALAAVAAATLLAAGCGGAAEPPTPLLSADALPGLHAVTRTLDAAGLAQATPLPGLRERLGEWGLRRAGEREFTGAGRDLDHVVARTVDFAEPDGAAAYQRALVTGTAGYLGSGAHRGRVPAGWLIRAPSCGCRPRPPTLIVVLRRGERVGWLSISGQAATAARVRALAGRLPL
jgi:plasmid stabilization system protein ParE